MGEMMSYFIFIYNAVIFWAFHGVFMCYPLINSYLFGKKKSRQ